MPLIYTEGGGIILNEEMELMPAYSPVCSFCAHLGESAARRSPAASRS